MLGLTEQQVLNILDDTAYALSRYISVMKGTQVEGNITNDVILDLCKEVTEFADGGKSVLAVVRDPK